MTRKFRSEYQTWMGMKSRCLNPKTRNYNDYGGRGITICERWMEFENFFQDMGIRPTDNHSLDRLNNDGNYEPSNCAWVLMIDNQNNRRNNVKATLHGKTLTLKQWSRELKINYSLLLRRKKEGWSDEKLLTKPIQKQKWRVSHRNSKGTFMSFWATYPFST